MHDIIHFKGPILHYISLLHSSSPCGKISAGRLAYLSPHEWKWANRAQYDCIFSSRVACDDSLSSQTHTHTHTRSVTHSAEVNKRMRIRHYGNTAAQLRAKLAWVIIIVLHHTLWDSRTTDWISKPQLSRREQQIMPGISLVIRWMPFIRKKIWQTLLKLFY